MIKIRLEALPNEVDEYLEHLKSDSKVNVLEVKSIQTEEILSL